VKALQQANLQLQDEVKARRLTGSEFDECRCSFHLIAKFTKYVPLGSSCGMECGNESCEINQVDVLAIRLLKCVGQHMHLRGSVCISGSILELAKLAQKVSRSPGPCKSPLEWEWAATMELLSKYKSQESKLFKLTRCKQSKKC
jgi:hypothetical protein